MDNKSFEKIFPLGSHLCREPMPAMSELKKDMVNLKKHGFNLVKLQENWMIDEPLEGHCDFSRYEELIACAAKLDMGVYLGLTCEQAPGWLWQKYPDCRMVGKNGVPIPYEAQQTLPADGKPGPCYDHPGAAAEMVRFIQKLVRTLGGYENLVVWNTWQEVGYWSESLFGQPVCYCPNTIRHYQQWLQERYGDLDALNRAWNARYLDWSYIVPDRVHWKWAMPQVMYWNYFMANIQIGHVLKTRAAAIRQADPLNRPIFAHKGGPQIASGADWTYARSQDFLGSSTYPAWAGATGEKHTSLLNEMYDGMVLKYDYVRSCNRRGAPVWAAEFQGGPVCTGFHKGRVPSADDIRRWMLSGIGTGVTAISFWVTRAEIAAGEPNGFSLLDSEGDTTERFEEAACVGKALGRHPELFAKPSWSGADVALLINEENYQFCQVMNQGGENLLTSVSGWHKALWNANIPADFIETMELDEDYIQKYKAIILPFPVSLSEAVAEKLVRYVKNGGNLISEAAPGRINENCFCTRGELSPAMKELFGVQQESFTMVREPNGGKVWSPNERTWGEYLAPAMLTGTGPCKSLRVRANVYIETFKLQGGSPFLIYNDAAAGVFRKAGKGTAWLLGTYIGHNANHYRDDESQQFIRSLLQGCGVKPIHGGKLILRKRIVKNKEAWLFTNPTPGDITETIAVKGWKKVEDLLGEKIQKQADTVELTVKPLDVRVLVLSRK
jgi:beta-galactosidase